MRFQRHDPDLLGVGGLVCPERVMHNVMSPLLSTLVLVAGQEDGAIQSASLAKRSMVFSLKP